MRLRDWAFRSCHNLSLIFACEALIRISDFSRVLDDGLLLLAVMVCFMATELTLAVVWYLVSQPL